jgi:hypothetical protein
VQAPSDQEAETVEVVGRLPSLEDDFVLRSVTLVGAQLHVGWV